MNNMGGITFNEDNSHFYMTRDSKSMDEEGMEKLVEQYAGSQVCEIMFNVNAMRTSYESKVWDKIWDGYNPDEGVNQLLFKGLPEDRQQFKSWVHNAWKVSRNGFNIYQKWIELSRIYGISPWISMRMNDVHNVDDESLFIHSDYWKEHPELRRVDYRFNELTDRAFDYGKKEVRDHHFKLIEEIAELYDMDGLELDWMRHGYHFRPGFEGEGINILTGFMTEVRHLLDKWESKRGHGIKLGVRVPSRPQTSLGLGMDAVTWAREGLIDMLVVTPFWETIETDMPMELWKQLLHGSNVILAAGLEILMRPYPESELRICNSLETVRGAAISLLDRGADRIYLFNYMDYGDIEESMPKEEKIDNYPALFKEIGSIDTMLGKPRIHVLTYPDTWAPGETKATALPAVCEEGKYYEFRIHIGPKPEKAQVNVIFGMNSDIPVEAGTCEVRLNGMKCLYSGRIELDSPKPAENVYSFTVCDEAAHGGYNLVEILPGKSLEIKWLEISIKY
jgi:hypothetical protein